MDVQWAVRIPENRLGQLAVGFLVIVALGAFLTASAAIFISVFPQIGSPSLAVANAEIAAGLSMSALVILTFWYAVSMNKMVRRERQEQKLKLREELFNEIDNNIGLVQWGTSQGYDISNLDEAPFSRNAFRKNRFSLHRLHDDEIDAIKSHYRPVRMVTVYSQHIQDNQDLRQFFEDLYEGGDNALTEIRIRAMEQIEDMD